ncbi:MAG: hypothetical protein WCX65_10580 [bacterium]
MKRQLIGKKFYAVIAFVIAGLICASVGASAGDQIKIYNKSLHKNAAGMKYWYEAKDGFKSVTGIPYESLACKECHATSCKNCHVKSLKAADTRDINTCLKCHERQGTGFAVDTAANELDFHRQMDMGCTDCHVANGHDDVHGDGVVRANMKTEGAVKAKCTDCHEEKADTRSHKIHKGKLDCPACHTNTSISCNNCHLDTYVKTKKKEGAYMPTKSWLMLINYKGKVTAGAAQTLVYKNKTFVAYSPYYSHSVQATAKKCPDCHANEAMKLVKAGKKIPMNPTVNGKVADWKGVIPCLPGSLQWTFYNKDGGKWVPISGGDQPKVQMVNYGTPLTAKQIRILKAPFLK